MITESNITNETFFSDTFTLLKIAFLYTTKQILKQKNRLPNQKFVNLEEFDFEIC
jgi:hypothetical protein